MPSDIEQIMHFSRVFHGEVGGTKEVYGPSLGIESLSGSPSTVTISSRSLCGLRGWRVEMLEGCGPVVLQSGVEVVKSGRISWCESALAPTSSV
jgi:hypothetical protein